MQTIFTHVMTPYFCEMSFFVVENISTEKEYENAKMFVQN